MTPLATPVRRFAANRRGRDFVVGDIHGMFSLVDQALLRVSFDPRRDRLFSVGDLVDRGPDSHRALEFLRRPYVHAVRGNHEDMLLDLYDGREPSEQQLEWEIGHGPQSWWLKLSPGQREEFIAAFRALPIAIEVALPRGRVGIVHADVVEPGTWDHFTALLEMRDRGALEIALWSRERCRFDSVQGVAGIDRVYVGHTVHPVLTAYGNVCVVDTGAVYGWLEESPESGHLSLVRIDEPFPTGDILQMAETGPQASLIPF